MPNEKLSKNRATSVLRYLAGLIGDRLTGGTPIDDLTELTKSGRITIKGHGEPPRAGGKEPATEEFDPTERRVDIKMSLSIDEKSTDALKWTLRRSGP